MCHEYLLWISLGAYLFHVLEEFFFDWKSWAEKISKLPNLKWRDFFRLNGALFLVGVFTSLIGWDFASLGLFIPALQLINGLFFHLIPTIIFRRLSPGTFTSCLLFLPLGILCYRGAWLDNVLTVKVAIVSFVMASLVMTLPYLFFRARNCLISRNK